MCLYNEQIIVFMTPEYIVKSAVFILVYFKGFSPPLTTFEHHWVSYCMCHLLIASEEQGEDPTH